MVKIKDMNPLKVPKNLVVKIVRLRHRRAFIGNLFFVSNLINCTCPNRFATFLQPEKLQQRKNMHRAKAFKREV